MGFHEGVHISRAVRLNEGVCEESFHHTRFSNEQNQVLQRLSLGTNSKTFC